MDKQRRNLGGSLGILKKAEVIRLASEGWNAWDISDAKGLDLDDVLGAIEHSRMTPAKKAKLRESRSSYVAVEDRQRIEKLFREGMTMAAIADKYNVATSTVWRAIQDVRGLV